MYSIHIQWYSRAFIYLINKKYSYLYAKSEVRFIILLEFAMRVNPMRIAKWGVILLWPSIFLSFNRPLPSSKNPHYQNEAKSTIFLVKMSFICMRMKNHFISKAEHLTSFWYRGPGNSELAYRFGRPQLPSNKARFKQNCNNHGPVVLAVGNYNIFKMAIILDLVLIKIIIQI